MPTTGDHNSGELQHPAVLRSGLRSWIDSVLGPEQRRAIFVNVMPSADTVDSWSEEKHATRTRSFCVACLCLVVAGMTFLEVLRLLLNAIIRCRKRSEGRLASYLLSRSAKRRYYAVLPPVSTPRQGPEAPLLNRSDVGFLLETSDEEEDADTAGELNNGEFETEDDDEDAEDVRIVRPLRFDSRDLFFTAYHGIYSVSCLAVTGYALQGECLSARFGLDYEFYIMWVVYIIGVHFACTCYAFKLGYGVGMELPSSWMAIPKSFDAGVGHLGVLRDAVTAGLFAQELTRRGGWDAAVLALITLVSAAGIFLPNVWIFPALYPLRDFEETYWPIIAQADQQFSQWRPDTTPERPGFIHKIRRALASIKDFWANKMKVILKHLEKGTRLHMKATSLLGDLPQAICGTIFLVRYSRPEGDLFVFLSTLISFTKFHTILGVLFLRFPTLCLMAQYEMEWCHPTGGDIRSGTTPFWLVKWRLQSAACRRVLKNPETTMDARIEALRSLHKLHHENDGKRKDLEKEEMAMEEAEHMEDGKRKDLEKEEMAMEEAEHMEDGKRKDLEKEEMVMEETEHMEDGKRKDLEKEEMAMEETEHMEARRAVLWEVAQQTDPRIQTIAKDFLDCDTRADAGLPGWRMTDWKAVAMQFRRFVKEGPGEKMEAMKQLTRDYPESSPAFAKNLLEDLSRKTTKALNRVPAESQETREQAEEENEAFAKKWRSMRDVRFAAAKALADLAIMSKQRDGDKKDKKGLTENQRSMALSTIKYVAPAVVELLDSNNPSISSAALVAVVAFRSQEEIEMAVKKAIELLKGVTKGMAILRHHQGANPRSLHKMMEEKRKTGEIVLVQLLPELTLASERETSTDSLRGQEYWLDHIVACGLDSRWKGRPEAATSRRVLARLGGRTAGLAKERLLKRSDLDLQGKDLLEVLEAQDKDLKNMNGDWRLCRSMNLNLAPREDSSVRSSLNESDLKEIAAGKEIFEVLGKKSLAYHITTHDDPDPNRPEDDGVTHVLPVFFSDLEPDDTMFIAEMWKFLRTEEENSTRGTRVCCEPMVIFATDLAEVDIGLIFEKKLTLAALVLGKVDYRVVTPSPNARKTKQANSKDGKDGKDGSKNEKGKDADNNEVDHKKVRRIGGLRDRNIKAIQERLRKFRGHVDFFVCAPGRGNLGEIVFGPDSSDTKFRRDLMKGKTFSVALYSGQFNVKNMEEDDLEGVLNLLEHVEKKAMMDVSKFPFWGGTEAHPATDGLSTFALPSFAPTVKCKYPEIAYLWSSFNDEFNCKLIHYDKLFGTAILGANLADKKAAIKGLYDKQKITEYAKRILHDDELFKQVEDRKRLTVKCFAYGCCHTPLCDQLIFVERWASVYQQFCQLWTDQAPEQWEPSWVRTVKGRWLFDKRLNNTIVDSKSTIKGAPNGAQPEIQFPCNVMAIYKISEALQDYTLNHLQELRTEKFKLTPFEAKQIKVIT